jgi:Zn-dependent peptidase ImmA (M78 family)
MAAKTEVPITGAVLAWAIDEAGLSRLDLATRLKVSPDTVDDWIDETAHPGKTEFNKILAAVRRPSAIFYMPEPPTQAGMPTYYRQAPGTVHHATSPQALREVRKARRIQQVMSWLLEDDQAPKIAGFTFDFRNDSPAASGAEVRASMGLSMDDQAGWRDASMALRNWRSIIDELGVLTFSLQLGTDDIRGFSAWDARAPIVAVNTAYNEPARIYTFGHELGHIVNRTESACFDWVGPGTESNSALERWCERFAAALILPADETARYVRREFGFTQHHQVTDFEQVIRISRRLKVSARAAAVTLIDLGLAPRGLYAVVNSRAKVVDRPRDTGSGGGGQPTAEKRLSQYGYKVSRTVTDAVTSGTLGLRDAADFLDVNLAALKDISDNVYLPGRPV